MPVILRYCSISYRVYGGFFSPFAQISLISLYAFTAVIDIADVGCPMKGTVQTTTLVVLLMIKVDESPPLNKDHLRDSLRTHKGLSLHLESAAGQPGTENRANWGSGGRRVKDTPRY